MNHNEKQIHDAFIDGYLSACGSGAHDAALRPEAERAWRRENTTERPSRRRPPNHPANRKISDPPGNNMGRLMCSS